MDIIIILSSIIICIILLKVIDLREKKMIGISNRVDLEKINQNLRENYKTPNIDLTTYEQEQEESAIISYEELINNKKNELKYDDTFENKSEVEVKKINLDDNTGKKVGDSKIDLSDDYAEEEEFLKALKELRINLAR